MQQITIFMCLLMITLSSSFAMALETWEKQEDLKVLQDLFAQNYALKDFKANRLAMPFEQILQKDTQTIIDTSNDEAFIIGLQSLVGRLSDWHVALYRPKVAPRCLGFAVDSFKDKAIVVATESNLGIKIGDELITIDNEPVLTTAQRLLI